MKIIFTLIALCFLSVCFAQTGKSDPLKDKVKVLVRFFEKQHYKPVQWNDSSSSRLFSRIMEETDEYKIFFTRQDMQSLEKFRYLLDDEILGRQWSFINTLVPIFKIRARQADSITRLILSKPIDISKPELLQWPFKDHALSLPELATRRRQYYAWRILYDLSDTLSSFKKKTAIAGKVPAGLQALVELAGTELKKEQLFYLQQAGYDTKSFENDFGELFLKAICWSYDPHTEYMNFAEKESFQSAGSAADYSTGINFEQEKNNWVIKFLVPGGPAWRSGLVHTGDVVQSIRGSNNNEIAVPGLNEEQFAGLIENPGADRLILTLKTATGLEQTVTLIKEKISSDEDIVKGFVLNGKEKIGYIQLPGFYSQVEDPEDFKGCANDVAKEIIKLKKDGIKGLVFDLRHNGGGSMWEAMELAGIFINDGPLGIFKDKNGKQTTLRDPNRGTIYDGPLIVLINGASASASEFTAAALQDYRRALIIGGNSFGKGTSQTVLPLDTTATLDRNAKTEDYVKVTGQKFYRVDGTTVQWKGVVPDIELPDYYQQDNLKERFETSALLPDSCKKTNYFPLSPIPVNELNVKSKERVNNAGYFNVVKKFLQLENAQGRSRIIPLNWEQYADDHRKRNAVIESLSAEDSAVNTIFMTANHSFDLERISYLSRRSIEINNQWLNRLKADEYLVEAYRIMLDWFSIIKK